MVMKEKGFTPIIILLAALLFGGVVVRGMYLSKKTSNQNQPTPYPSRTTFTPTQPTTSPITASEDPIANWKTYTNTTWNYQFQYPSTWIVEELDMEHVVVTSPDVEKSTDGRIVKFPAIYIRINIINRENITSSFEEEIKSVYTEGPQCSVGSECSSSPSLITKKNNANSLEYYSLTTGVYNNELAIFSLPKDKNRYVFIDSRLPLAFNIKLPEKILSTFRFTN